MIGSDTRHFWATAFKKWVCLSTLSFPIDQMDVKKYVTVGEDGVTKRKELPCKIKQSIQDEHTLQTVS